MQNINPTGNTAVSVDFGVANEDDKIREQLMLLENAIKEKCAVRFSYTNSHDEVKDIQVEPIRLQYKWYNWYLVWNDSFLWKQGQDYRAAGNKGTHYKNLQRNTDGI